MSRQFKLKLLAAAIILSMLSTTGAYAPATFAHTGVEGPVSHQDIYARTEQHAAEVMVHLAKAREALHRNDITDARAEIQFANTLITSVEESLPTYRLHRQIEVAKLHLSFSPPADVTQDFVPIRRSINVLTDFLPGLVTDQYYAHVDAIQGDMKREDREHALELLADLDNAVGYSEIDMSVYSTRRHIADALSALNINNLRAANKSLMAAENEVVVITTGDVGLSAYSVRDSFDRAEKRYRQSSFEEARAEIDNAIKLLSLLAATGSDQSRKYASELLTEAEALQKDFESRAPGTAHRIRHLATLSHAFAQREYKSQHAEPAASNLIEAEFHVTRAASDVERGRAVNEMQKGEASAKDELTHAKAYLEKANAISHYGGQPALKKVIDEVKHLALAPAAEPSMNSFYNVEREISGLIRNAS
jgi:hypothetical protein